MRGGEGNPSHDERELKANNSGTAYEIRRCEEDTQIGDTDRRWEGPGRGTAAILCRIHIAHWDLGCRPGDSPIGWFCLSPASYILL